MSSKAVKQTKKPISKAKNIQAAPATKTSGAETASRRASAPVKRAAQTPPQVHTPAEISHRIHALLHTIHQVERYEERLCSMQDAIRRTGRLSAPLLRDLRALVNELPSTEYQHDLDALHDAIR